MIQQFQDNARHYAAMASLLAERNVAGQDEQAKEWWQLYQDLTDVERDCDHMVGRLCLDRALLFRIYHQTLPLRNTWMHYRTRRLNPADKERGEAVREQEEQWTTFMTKIKKMLVASR